MTVEILKQKGHRFLWVDDYLWMWDIPVEREAQQRIADQAYGNVLVAGYGLGLIQELLSRNRVVNNILTIEINSEVLKACIDDIGFTYGCVEIGDFFALDYAKKWDCVIGDIWQDIVPESLAEYKRFKAKAMQVLKPDGKVLAWGKEFFEYLIEKESE